MVFINSVPFDTEVNSNRSTGPTREDGQITKGQKSKSNVESWALTPISCHPVGPPSSMRGRSMPRMHTEDVSTRRGPMRPPGQVWWPCDTETPYGNLEGWDGFQSSCQKSTTTASNQGQRRPRGGQRGVVCVWHDCCGARRPLDAGGSVRG